jgi:hypothetical protein
MYCLIALLPSVADAAPAVRLSYQRGAGAERCPDELAVRSAVAARLGYDPFHEPAQLELEARVAAQGTGLLGSVTAKSSDGQSRGSRELRSEQADCAELSSALELAISIAIDPPSIMRPAGAPPKAPEPPPPPPAPAPAAPSPWAHPIWEVQAGAAVSFGVAPTTAAWGFVLGAAARWPWLSAGLEGRADLPATGPAASGQARTSLIFASFVPCARLWYFGACAIFSGGALRAEGVDLPDSRQYTSAYLALGARLTGELELGRYFALRAQVELRTPVVRTTLTVAGDPVWTEPPIAGSLGIVGVLRIP